MYRISLIVSSVFILFISACKKDIKQNPPTVADSTVSQTNLLEDSLYLYTKEIYLWQDVIPSYATFNPRQYNGATDLDAATAEMNAIRKLEPLDRFSFVTTNATSAGLQTGASVDYGFFVKAAYIDQALPLDSVRWFVTYVYNQSPAGLAGVSRGWFINKINNTVLDYSQATFDLLNATLLGTSNSASFEFVKPDGTVFDSNLSKTSYVANSVLYQNVIETQGKKVGYVVFNQFFAAPSRVELNTVFSGFQSRGIDELVVDLRYNRGGSTDTQEALADLIAPSSANNQVMYKYVYNANLQQGNFPLLQKKTGYSSTSFAAANNTRNFQNAGSLNLSRVFFIVTRSTASASELLINNLKPYMDVKLVGDTTYGKPVGFFPVDIYNYSIYPISFKTVNSAGNADYYSGFAPDKRANDGVGRNWGDVTESSLASALKYITTGSFRVSQSGQPDRLPEAQQQLTPANLRVEQNKFTGMFREKSK